MSCRSIVAVAVVWAVLVVAGSAGAATCETVARRNQLDPLGRVIANSFRSEVAVNNGGDVLFVTRAKGGRRALYRYPDGGSAEIVVETGATAPTGQAYRDVTRPSIDDAGDVAFRAKLTGGGEGIFYRDAGESIVTAVTTTDTAPSGGVFDEFPSVSDVTDSAQVAFVATVSGGPSGVFRWSDPDALLPTTPIALAGALDPDGKPYCTFVSVGAQGPAVAWVAGNDTASCAAPASPGTSLYVFDGSLTQVVARVGDATPISGTTYTGFVGAPEVVSAGHVAFRATYDGVLSGTGVFLYDGSSLVTLVRTGDVVPGGAGAAFSLASIGMADADRIFVRAGLRGGTARAGIFLYAPSASTLVLSSDAVPTDAYGAGALYRKVVDFSNAPGAATKLAFVARVKDTVAPASKTGVFRCDVP